MLTLAQALERGRGLMGLQNKGTASHYAPCCQIIGIGDRGSRRHGKLHEKAKGVDGRFYSLDERGQRAVLANMIGYLKATNDLVSAGGKTRPNEVSRAFSAMEDMINEAWDGGMV